MFVATTFEDVHGEALIGQVCTVDRMIFNGHLMSFYPQGSFAAFLARQGVKLTGFARYVRRATEALRTHAQKVADEAGRPYVYMPHILKGKDDWARGLAKRDGISSGLIGVLATLEMRDSFGVEGNRRTHMLEVTRRRRKCLHIYFYLIDPEFGLMHVRLQTWFPFQIQVYVNGREWLARRLDECGIGYERYDNTFLRIDDLAVARKLCERLAHRKWPRVLDALARRFNPWLPTIRRFSGAGYYWVIDQCEIATDLMWRERSSLQAVLPDLFDHALRAFSADDVMRFLGRRQLHHFEGEVVSDLKQRPEGRRVKHRVGRNSIKVYDKSSVLRVETTINRPNDFRVYRPVVDRRGRSRWQWAAMTKGVANLWRYIQVGRQANERYLNALACAVLKGEAVDALDGLCQSRTLQGKHYARFNPVTAADSRLFQAVLAGEHAINGFRNRDLQARLQATPHTSRRQECVRTSRLIAKLRGHGLIAKVHKHRLYRVTALGHRVMAAALYYRYVAFPEGLTKTA